MLLNPPEFTAAKKRYTSASAGGFDGSLIEDDGTRDNITITCRFSLHRNVRDRYRRLREWLSEPCGYLTYDREWYYQAVMVDLGSLDHQTPQYGEADAVFTCLPYEYHASGLNWYTSEGKRTFHNAYGAARPVYKITGEGSCTIRVNGKTVSCNIGQNLTIDVMRQLAYRTDGTIMNNTLTGEYDDLILANGTNTVEIPSGFKMEIQPRWGWLM